MSDQLTEKHLGFVGVDSGQIRVGDPHYLNPEGERFCVTFQSGHGDGIYSVYGLLDENDRVLGVRIDMAVSAERHPNA